MKHLIFISAFFLLAFSGLSQTNGFVQVVNNQFLLDNKPYKFIGANLWYGMYLGMPGNGEGNERLIRELDQLKSLGVTNLRILGSTEGTGKYQVLPALQPNKMEYNEEVFQGLDFLLDEMGKRGMKAVFVLNNFWMWSGGMPQYVSWVEGSSVPYPDIENGSSWDPFIDYSLSFYENRKAQGYFRKHIKTLLNRVNSVNGLTYKNDPTIMAWQLCNEPRGYTKQEAYRNWIKRTSRLIDRLDKNHLISVGAEGDTDSDYAGVDLYKDNAFSAIDYATVHVWIQNWGWYDPSDPQTFEESIKKTNNYLSKQLEQAGKLNKPIVIEEFGVSRDRGSYNVDSDISYRNNYYELIFNYTLQNIKKEGLIQGCNFWAWGGEGRPVEPGGFWEFGDELIGDPPHERQGWYSVYDYDGSTLKLIKNYNELLDSLLKSKKLTNVKN